MRCFRTALREVYGTTGPMDEHDFSGKSDMLSLREILSKAGLSAKRIDEGAGRFRQRYLTELRRRIPHDPVQLLPGVSALLEELASFPQAYPGIVTGNIREGAVAKLKSGRLLDHFTFGAFGSDSEDRNVLPGIAINRARARHGISFRKTDAVVIGDTPRDVWCGDAIGARTLAVGTGRNHSLADLKAAGATWVLPALDDTARVAELLLSGDERTVRES